MRDETKKRLPFFIFHPSPFTTASELAHTLHDVFNGRERFQAD